MEIHDEITIPGQDLNRFVPFSVGVWSAHICSGSWLRFGWIIPAAGVGVSIGRMWTRLSKLSQHWADGAQNIASVRAFLQLSSLRDKVIITQRTGVRKRPLSVARPPSPPELKEPPGPPNSRP